MDDFKFKNPLTRRLPNLDTMASKMEKQPQLRRNFGNIGRKYSGGRSASTSGAKRGREANVQADRYLQDEGQED